MADRYVTLDDFSGGESSMNPAQGIAKDEAAKLTNLVPGLDGQPLKVRGGALGKMLIGDGPIRGLYRFSRADVSSGQATYDIVASGGGVFYIDDV